MYNIGEKDYNKQETKTIPKIITQQNKDYNIVDKEVVYHFYFFFFLFNLFILIVFFFLIVFYCLFLLRLDIHILFFFLLGLLTQWQSTRLLSATPFFTHFYEAIGSSILSVEFVRPRLIQKGRNGKSSMSYQWRILKIFHSY